MWSRREDSSAKGLIDVLYVPGAVLLGGEPFFLSVIVTGLVHYGAGECDAVSCYD